MVGLSLRSMLFLKSASDKKRYYFASNQEQRCCNGRVFVQLLLCTVVLVIAITLVNFGEVTLGAFETTV